MNQFELQYMYGYRDFLKYTSNNEKYDEIEVQFDDGKFNGKIYVAEKLKEDEEVHDYKELEYGELYEHVKNTAINDYNYD